MSLESVLRRVLQRNRPEQEIYTDIYYYRLAHMTLEAEQFLNLELQGSRWYNSV